MLLTVLHSMLLPFHVDRDFFFFKTEGGKTLFIKIPVYVWAWPELNELSPGRVFGTSIPRVRKVWVYQPRDVGICDGKLILLSGIHPSTLIFNSC